MLRIAERVVAKIAARAAGEVIAGTSTGSLVPWGRLPRAVASVRRDAARVRLSVELGYPVDIAGVCGAVRRHVADQIELLTGMRVTQVDVEVERLHSAAVRKRRGGRCR